MDIVERLDGLINAYPLDIFPEPSAEDRAWVEEARPGFQAQIVASWARHLGRPLAEARAEITALRARVEDLERVARDIAARMHRQVKASDAYAEEYAKKDEVRPTAWQIGNSHFTDMARELDAALRAKGGE